jgi:hypothetical protein
VSVGTGNLENCGWGGSVDVLIRTIGLLPMEKSDRKRPVQPLIMDTPEVLDTMVSN